MDKPEQEIDIGFIPRRRPKVEFGPSLTARIEVIEDFKKRLLEVQKELPPEYAKVIQDNFWDLV